MQVSGTARASADFVAVDPLDPADGAVTAALRAMVRATKGVVPRGSEGRTQYDALIGSVAPRDDVTFEADLVGGVPGIWVHPANLRPGQAILHLHGGWFNLGSANAYRHLVGQIAARAGVQAFVTDYRLAPEHPFPAATDDMLACYRALAESPPRKKSCAWRTRSVQTQDCHDHRQHPSHPAGRQAGQVAGRAGQGLRRLLKNAIERYTLDHRRIKPRRLTSLKSDGLAAPFRFFRGPFLALSLFLTTPAMAQKSPSGPPAVGVTKAQTLPITETSSFVGRIQSPNRVDVVARVTAFLQEQRFVEGSEVIPGELLYQLERGPFAADVAAKQGAVEQAKAQLQLSNLTLGRAETLLNSASGQQSTVDFARATQLTNQALLAQAQAQLDASKISLDYTEIKSPIAGKIGRTSVTIGNVVSPGSAALATVVSQDPMNIVSLRSLSAPHWSSGKNTLHMAATRPSSFA
jgi:hypothetical protein